MDLKKAGRNECSDLLSHEPSLQLRRDGNRADDFHRRAILRTIVNLDFQIVRAGISWNGQVTRLVRRIRIFRNECRPTAAPTDGSVAVRNYQGRHVFDAL